MTEWQPIETKCKFGKEMLNLKFGKALINLIEKHVEENYEEIIPELIANLAILIYHCEGENIDKRESCVSVFRKVYDEYAFINTDEE